MVHDGERTSVSYSDSTDTRSRNTAFTASCQDQSDSGKYDSGRKSAFSTSAGKNWPPSGKRRSSASGAQVLGGNASSTYQILCSTENHCVYRRARSEPQAEPAPDSPVSHAVAQGLVSEKYQLSRRGSPRTWAGALAVSATRPQARCGNPAGMLASPPARTRARSERWCI